MESHTSIRADSQRVNFLEGLRIWERRQPYFSQQCASGTAQELFGCCCVSNDRNFRPPVPESKENCSPTRKPFLLGKLRELQSKVSYQEALHRGSGGLCFSLYNHGLGDAYIFHSKMHRD